MFYLNVRGNNDDVQAYMTYNWRWFMYAAFHNALYWHLSRDTDELDVVLLEIYQGIRVPKLLKTVWPDKIIAKIKWSSFLLTVYTQYNTHVVYMYVYIYITIKHIYARLHFFKILPALLNVLRGISRVWY